MDFFIAFVVLIPSTLSLITSLIYAYIALKKVKEPPKDEVWETATKLLCSNPSSMTEADDFAILYEELKLFKDNGCSRKDMTRLANAVKKKHIQQSKQQSAKG